MCTFLIYLDAPAMERLWVIPRRMPKMPWGFTSMGWSRMGIRFRPPSATPEVDPETAAGYLVCSVTAKIDKTETFKHFLSLFPEKGLDLDPEEVREERLR